MITKHQIAYSLMAHLAQSAFHDESARMTIPVEDVSMTHTPRGEEMIRVRIDRQHFVITVGQPGETQ